MKSTSIFAVEDDFLISKIIEAQIKKNGYSFAGTCTTAEDALLALEEMAARGDLPDIILMDIRLAGKMDGIEAAQIISGKYESAVIYLTGCDQKDIFKRAMSSKPRAYILKPFDDKQLRMTIETVIYQQELELAIKKHQAELQELNTRLIHEVEQRHKLEKLVNETSEQEKETLGQNLHDDLGQILTVINIKAETLKNRLLKKDIAEAGAADEIVTLTTRANSQVRDLAKMLFPLTLRTEGLISALQELASYAKNYLDIPCNTNLDENAAKNLNLMTATNLYRIAQESITNAVKHGKASRIDIGLARSNGQIVLTVKDDGKGIKMDSDFREGVGLPTMRYRAQMIQGALEIKPGQDGGTIVRYSFDPNIVER